MPVSPTYPGVYIEEISSGVRTITGVPTSITAFIGRAKRGPVNEPTTIGNFGDYERIFGGLWEESTMSYAVRDFFMNGGSQAIIVRIYSPIFTDEETRTTIYNNCLSIAKGAASEEANAISEAAQTYETSNDDIILSGNNKYNNNFKSNPTSNNDEKASDIAAKYVLDAAISAKKLKTGSEDVANAVNATKATGDAFGKIAGYAMSELTGITNSSDIPSKITEIKGKAGNTSSLENLAEDLTNQTFREVKIDANAKPVDVSSKIISYINKTYAANKTLDDKVNKSIAYAVQTAVNDAADSNKFNNGKQPEKLIRAAHSVKNSITVQIKIIDRVMEPIDKSASDPHAREIIKNASDALTFSDFSGTEFSGMTTLCAIISVTSGIIYSEVEKYWKQSYNAVDVAKAAADVKDLTKYIVIAADQALQEVLTTIDKAENSKDTLQNLIDNINGMYTIDSNSSVQTKVKFILTKALANLANNNKTSINTIRDSIGYAIKFLTYLDNNNRKMVESIVETIADSLVKSATNSSTDGARSIDLIIASNLAKASAAIKAASTLAPISKAILRLSTQNTDFLMLTAANEGSWGNNLQAGIDYDVNTELPDATDLFNLTVKDTNTGKKEIYRNLSVNNGHRRNIEKVLKQESTLVVVSGTIPNSKPNKTITDPSKDLFDSGNFVSVSDNDHAVDSQPLIPNDYCDENDKCGIRALEKADIFNLLCIPTDVWNDNTNAEVYKFAMKYCFDKRAVLIVDSPHEWGTNISEAATRSLAGLSSLGLNGEYARNAVLYFPRVNAVDPLKDGQINTFVPCGIIAGVITRTDAQRGVWKAPAGLDASLNGIAGLQINLTDAENGRLNPRAINCLRLRPAAGPVVWGARTMRGDDSIGDEYKYVPVRRTALFIEETLYRSLQWVVFEPNDEPLWAQIRLNVGAFMHGLFRQGAFQGTMPKDAYYVKCDKETNPQEEINQGRVNVEVGFAPLKPAEFVIIKVQQIAGQIQM